MSMFTPTSGYSQYETLPAGINAWGQIGDIKIVPGKSADKCQQITFSLKIVETHPKIDGRKIFERMGDPYDARISDGWKDMSIRALTRIMETLGVFQAAHPGSYASLDGKTIQDVAQMIDGKVVGFQVAIEDGVGGYEEKNRVGDYATPVQKSKKGFKIWTSLMDTAKNQAEITSLLAGSTPAAAFNSAPAAFQAPVQQVFGQQPQAAPVASVPAALQQPTWVQTPPPAAIPQGVPVTAAAPVQQAVFPPAGAVINGAPAPVF